MPQNRYVAISDVTAPVNQIAQTTVRILSGQFLLDEVLTKPIKINEKIKNRD